MKIPGIGQIKRLYIIVVNCSELSSRGFPDVLDAALRDYKNTTGKSLLDDPLADKVQQCDSVDTLKAIFQDQAKALRSKDGDERSMKWIDPTVDVLSKISDTLGGVAGIVRH